jgi:cation diffusion facilitator family transporter
MFVVEVASGWLAHSTGLVADGLDMLTDASAYAIALVAIGRSQAFKAKAATLSGALLLLVGIGLLIEIAWLAYSGSEPAGAWMMAVALVALAVNIIVLRLLARHRSDEVHLRAAWIFTRADVVANAAVIVSGAAVIATGIRFFDLLVGAGIGLYVIKEAFEILGEAKAARGSA